MSSKMAISEIFVLVGIFFGPHEKNNLYILLSDFFLKMQKVFCDYVRFRVGYRVIYILSSIKIYRKAP